MCVCAVWIYLPFNLGIVWCFVYYCRCRTLWFFPSINFTICIQLNEWVSECERESKWMDEISTEVGTEGEGGCTTFLVSMSLIIFFDRNTHASVSRDILSLSPFYMLFLFFNFLLCILCVQTIVLWSQPPKSITWIIIRFLKTKPWANQNRYNIGSIRSVVW